MKSLTALATAATLSFAGTAALAAGPVQMTDDQLDNVTAGLVNVELTNVDILRGGIQVAVPVAAALNLQNVQVGVLSDQFQMAADQTAQARPGRIRQ